MKKIIVLLVAIVTCACALFTGCNNSTGYDNKLSIDANGAVSSNGGFAVVKGEHLYFINGIASYTEDNTYGDVQAGALYRVKLSDLANPKDANPEQVIPALFVAGDLTSGFYIFGNDVYYASPVTTKNKEGVVENTKLDFIKTSLNGKTSVTLKTVADRNTGYRFVEANGVVYLVLKTVNEDNETVVEIINATENKVVCTTDKVASVIFADDNSTGVFYTRVAHDETLDKDEAFNGIHRVSVDGTDELLLLGNGLYDNETGFGLSGATFALIKETKDHLYFSATYVDTSVTTVVKYYALAKDGLTKENAAEKLTLINEGTASAATVFAATSYYANTNAIVYLDATYGLIKYDYTVVNDANSPEGRVRIFYDKDLVGYTVKFWNNGYLYLTDSNSNYFRVNVDALIDDNTENDDVKVEKVNFLANSTSWYIPEVITHDGNEYFLSVYTAEPYSNLVFVSNIAANNSEDMTDEKIEEIREITEEQVSLNLEASISFITESVQETIDKYFEDNFSEEE